MGTLLFKLRLPTHCLFVSGVVFLTIVALSAAQEASSVEDSLTIIAPSDDDTMSDTYRLSYLVGIPDDSDRVVALGSRWTVNAWSLLIWYWPEIAGIMLGTMSLWWVWVLLRRRGLVGRPFCPRCRYLLVDHAGDRCPECGIEFSSAAPRIGRPWKQSMSVCVAGIIILAGGYVAERASLPRHGTFSSWMEWPSTFLFEWSRAQGKDWTRHSGYDQCLIEIDVVSLRVARKSRTTMKGRIGGVAYSPNARAVAVLNTKSIQLFDLDQNVLVSEVFHEDYAEEFAPFNPTAIRALALASDSQTLFMGMDWGDLLIWDLVRKTARPLGKKEIVSRSGLHPRLDAGRLAVWLPGMRWGWEWREYDLVSRQFVRAFTSLEMRKAIGPIALDAAQTCFAVVEEDSGRIDLWDIADASCFASIEMPRSDLRPSAISADRRWVLAETPAGSPVPPRPPTTVYVFDTEAHRCVARIDTPLDLPRIVIMPDGLRVVAFGRGGAGTPRRLIYDLTPLMSD